LIEFRSWFQRMRDTLTIRVQTALLVAFVCTCAVAVAAAGAAYIARSGVVAAADRELQALARNMADRLDQHMFERCREIQNIAHSPTLRGVWQDNPAVIRETLERVQSSLPEYAWLGFATTDGNVRAATKGMLEGVSVSSRPWFVNGSKAATVEDVHDAKLLDKLLRTSPDEAPFRFVDVAVPVVSTDGVAGVLGAHMSWVWAEDVKRTVLSGRQADGAELWVIGRDGTMLIGPHDRILPQERVQEDVQTFTDVALGGDMRTSIVATKGYQNYPGLGWRVAARKPVQVIYGPANALVVKILIVGGVAALLASAVAWLLAGTVTKPLHKLSHDVDQIGRQSGATTVERQHGSREVLHLSAAIRSLVRRVGVAEADQHAATSAMAALQLELENRTKESKEKAMRFGADLHALRALADTDGLTGLLNRRAFLPFAEDALSYFKRYQRPFSILMFDIDHFKRVNDTYGHAVGDEVIRAVGASIREEIRTTDKVARFGGEEFVVLLRETDELVAAKMADRLKRKIAALRVVSGDQTVKFTTSVGCAVSDERSRDVEDIIQRADKALYTAKSAGRNRVRVYRESSVDSAAA
jgi:diguanylate cyclase (GGDEF)-like protein